ncbi:MAG: formate dehydrogenase accessory sulfurtransferase FdhD [Ferroplasma sp.]
MNGYVKKKIVKFSDEIQQKTDDYVTEEEPMEIRISMDDKIYPVSVIMRTPINDFELAAGFLFDEGIIKQPDIIGIYNDPMAPPSERKNIIIVKVRDFKIELLNQRNFYVNSSCGVCGKTNLNNVFVKNPVVIKNREKIDAEILTGLPDKMIKNQEIFGYTGGIHAAAIFDYSGELLCISEDIGRHNAVDKSIGKLLLKGVNRNEQAILQVSGRASFEIVQKASMFGISIISSVSAPSSLAIELADIYNITLASFLRKNSFNIYSNEYRIK